jgi:hypothetical protein
MDKGADKNNKILMFTQTKNVVKFCNKEKNQVSFLNATEKFQGINFVNEF